MHKIVFADGRMTEVETFHGYAMYSLQDLYRSPIVTVDGVPTAFWGMTKSQIKKAKKTMKEVNPIIQLIKKNKPTKIKKK